MSVFGDPETRREIGKEIVDDDDICLAFRGARGIGVLQHCQVLSAVRDGRDEGLGFSPASIVLVAQKPLTAVPQSPDGYTGIDPPIRQTFDDQ
jgi:hypothetical protein